MAIDISPSAPTTSQPTLNEKYQMQQGLGIGDSLINLWGFDQSDPSFEGSISTSNGLYQLQSNDFSDGKELFLTSGCVEIRFNDSVFVSENGTDLNLLPDFRKFHSLAALIFENCIANEMLIERNTSIYYFGFYAIDGGNSELRSLPHFSGCSNIQQIEIDEPNTGFYATDIEQFFSSLANSGSTGGGLYLGLNAIEGFPLTGAYATLISQGWSISLVNYN